MILDTANNENFLIRTEEDAKILLNNFASGSLDDRPSHTHVNSRSTEHIERLTKQLKEFSKKNRGMEVSLARSKNPLYLCEMKQGSITEGSNQDKSKLEDILENILASQKRIEARCDTLEAQLNQPAPINALTLRSGKALDEPYQQTQKEGPITSGNHQ